MDNDVATLQQRFGHALIQIAILIVHGQRELIITNSGVLAAIGYFDCEGCSAITIELHAIACPIDLDGALTLQSRWNGVSSTAERQRCERIALDHEVCQHAVINTPVHVDHLSLRLTALVIAGDKTEIALLAIRVCDPAASCNELTGIVIEVNDCRLCL